MGRWVGPLTAEVIQGEGRKFTAPVVLVHGLWSTHVVWRRFVGFLGHRGWTSIAVDLRGRDGSAPALGMQQHLDDLRAVLATLEAPPVVVGHDLGGLLALHLTEARAVVALAPLVPCSPELPFRNAGSILERWRGQPLRSLGKSWNADYPECRQLREPATVIGELVGKPWTPPALPAEVPGFVLAAERDRIVAPQAVRQLASASGADFEICPGVGHALLTDDGWEERVSIVHRWLIRKLGAPLLALYEEAMNPER